MEVLQKINNLLDSRSVGYICEHHEPTRTSEEAAKTRGVSLHSGAKALVIQGNKSKKHWLFVMPADLRLDSKRVREIVGEPIGFASNPEDVTGCVPGSVPPFGSVIGLQTYCDGRLAENDEINFNAGSLTDSIRMRFDDYVAIERPIMMTIASSAS